jgi:hypothetical protein
MAARKMFPLREVKNLFGDDKFELRIGFRIQAGQVVMQFSDPLERVRMGSGCARKLAAMLTGKAAEFDGLGNADSRSFEVRSGRLLRFWLRDNRSIAFASQASLYMSE